MNFGIGEDNFLINSEAIIAQRVNVTNLRTSPGIAYSASTRYVLDRWVHDSPSVAFTAYATNSTLLPTYVYGTYKMQLAATATASSTYVAIRQKIDPLVVLQLNNRYLMLSAWVRSNSANARLFYTDGTTTYVSTDPHSGGGTFEYLTMPIYLSSGVSTLTIGLMICDESGGTYVATTITSGDYIDLCLPKLELGYHPTTFRPRNIGKTVELCERYYEKSYDIETPSGTATNNGEIQRYTVSTVNMSVPAIRFRTRKRGTPSIAVYSIASGASGYAYNYSASADNALSSIFNIGETGFCITGSWTAGNNRLGFHWVADAEL